MISNSWLYRPLNSAGITARATMLVYAVPEREPSASCMPETVIARDYSTVSCPSAVGSPFPAYKWGPLKASPHFPASFATRLGHETKF